MRSFLGAVLLVAACAGQDAGVQESVRAAAAVEKAVPVQTGQVAKVMTRNLYLGGDLSPAIGTSTLKAFIEGTSKVWAQVQATNFPVRAKGVAQEILAEQPDLVGVQEAALWRIGPFALGAPPSATDVVYDYLQLLLDELGGQYQVAAVQEEFDFEAPADTNGVLTDGLYGADHDVRLTMRDAILVRVANASVRVSNPRAGHFVALLKLPVMGQAIPVTRGWVSVDASVRGTVPFRFVATHLEAFDPRVVHPSIRAQQAAELVAPGGPATGALPVVLVGDLNSDDDTVAPDDQQAYRVLLAAGFEERSTATPLSCCVESYDLTTGSVDEFDHQVDHIMTNATDVVRLAGATVTGRSMSNGYWDSDHAGVVSSLHIR